MKKSLLLCLWLIPLLNHTGCWSVTWQSCDKMFTEFNCKYNVLKPWSFATTFKLKVKTQTVLLHINTDLALSLSQISFCVFLFTATPQIQKLMTVMIRQHEALFPPSKDVLPSPPSKKVESKKSTPRSFVGWESAEVPKQQQNKTFLYCNRHWVNSLKISCCHWAVT